MHEPAVDFGARIEGISSVQSCKSHGVPLLNGRISSALWITRAAGGITWHALPMRRPTVPQGTGPFRTEMAGALGFTESGLRTAIRHRHVLVLRRGVLVSAADRDVAAANPQTLHAQDIQALLLAMRRTNIAAAGTSAARIFGLELLHAPPPALIVCTDDPGVSGTHKNDYFLRAAPLPPGHVVTRLGVPVTSIERTLLDLAASMPFVDAVVLAESAYRKRLTTVEKVAAVVTASEHRPGIEQARLALGFANPWTGSVLESVSRVSMRAAGIRLPKVQQAVIVGDDAYLVDFLWDHLPIDVLGEADGTEKSVGASRLETVRAIRAEKERHQKLISTGAEIVRWGWPEARNPDLLARVINAGFARALERSRGRLSG
jgi:hypothetical protein